MMRLRAGEKFCLIYALAFLAALMLAGRAVSGCLADGGTFRTSLNCRGEPSIPKFFEVSTFSWGGRDYLALNTGNELSLYRITDPLNPTPETASHFNVGNQGDSDYDLLNYSICDDCRYGVATYKLGTVLFDLGTGAAPRFVASRFYGTSSDPRGAFTFEHGGAQYLLANYLPDDCGSDATLYRYGGPQDIEPVGCLDVPGFAGKFINGVKIDGSYLYLGFYDNWLYIYRVGSGGSLSFVAKSPIRASMARGKGFAVDRAAGLAVSSFVNGGMRVWNISAPAAPVEVASVAGNFGLTAMRHPFAWVAQPMAPDSSRTFDIGAQPVPMDQEFWSPDNPWNNHNPPPAEQCEWPTSAAFSPDGTAMYLARYNVAQVIDFSACPPPLFADGFDGGDTSAWSATVP